MKTNIATSCSQSKRLLRCGVSADTADMFYTNYPNKPNDGMPYIGSIGIRKDLIPAWSLSALLGLLPKGVFDKDSNGFYFSLAKEFPLSEEYGAVYIPCWDKGDAIVRKRDNNPIEACVQLIEWLTENNYKLNEI